MGSIETEANRNLESIKSYIKHLEFLKIGKCNNFNIIIESELDAVLIPQFITALQQLVDELSASLKSLNSLQADYYATNEIKENKQRPNSTYETLTNEALQNQSFDLFQCIPLESKEGKGEFVSFVQNKGEDKTRKTDEEDKTELKCQLKKCKVSRRPESHECQKCGRSFSKWKHLAFHLKKLHRNDSLADDQAELPETNPLSVFCCQTCNIACTSQELFSTHICKLPTIDSPTATANNLCNRILVSSVAKLQKMKRFICSICGLEFRDYKRIIYHLPRCLPGPYICNLCNTSFESCRQLNYHKKNTHKGEKCFSCLECGKCFERMTSLRKHSVRWHESLEMGPASASVVGPFRCDQCPKKFIKKIYLTNHKLRMHGLDKKFLCQVCGNKFLTQASLNTHMEVHNQGKTYNCSFCSKVFIRKERLKYHERLHTGERPFKCSICGSAFVSKYHLQEHLNRHNKERRHRCPHCIKGYASSWDLKQHIKKHHTSPGPPEICATQPPVQPTVETVSPNDCLPINKEFSVNTFSAPEETSHHMASISDHRVFDNTMTVSYPSIHQVPTIIGTTDFALQTQNVQTAFIFTHNIDILPTNL